VNTTFVNTTFVNTTFVNTTFVNTTFVNTTFVKMTFMSMTFMSTTYSHVNRKIFEEIGKELKYFNPKNIVLKLSEVMVGSGIRIRDPDPGPGKNLSGSRIQGSKMHRIPDPGSGSEHCFFLKSFYSLVL